VRLTHGGYDTQRASKDPDVVFPVRTLRRLAETGAIGSVAAVAASTMGYIPRALNVLERVVPPVVASLVAQQVDLALLVPA
jgi:D-proline reductase (dithiol) PrdB